VYDVRYVEKNLSSQVGRRNGFYLVNVVGVVFFLFISFFLGPVVHEWSQMALLALYDCHYAFSPFFDWRFGMNASVAPFCSLSPLQEVALYSVGIGLNLSLALVFMSLSWFLLKRGRFSHSNFCLYLGVGFSFNPIVYFFADRGNLINLLGVFGVGDLAFALPLAGSVLFALEVVYSYAVVKYYLREYENIRRQIERIRGFIEDINFGEGV